MLILRLHNYYVVLSFNPYPLSHFWISNFQEDALIIYEVAVFIEQLPEQFLLHSHFLGVIILWVTYDEVLGVGIDVYFKCVIEFIEVVDLRGVLDHLEGYCIESIIALVHRELNLVFVHYDVVHMLQLFNASFNIDEL
jgi:hypothetical protein